MRLLKQMLIYDDEWFSKWFSRFFGSRECYWLKLINKKLMTDLVDSISCRVNRYIDIVNAILWITVLTTFRVFDRQLNFVGCLDTIYECAVRSYTEVQRLWKQPRISLLLLHVRLRFALSKLCMAYYICIIWILKIESNWLFFTYICKFSSDFPSS